MVPSSPTFFGAVTRQSPVHNKSSSSPKLKGLNHQPRRSPRQQQQQLHQIVYTALTAYYYRILACRRYHVFVYLWMLLFPTAWVLLHWKLADTATTNKPQQHRMQRDVGNRDAAASIRGNSNTAPLSLFDPAENPVIPPSLYRPKSANPLQVLYIGVATELLETGSNETTSVWMDALERSRYTRLSASFLYERDGQLIEEFYGSFDTDELSAVVVDWFGDCLILQRIVRYINRRQNLLQQSHVLLLDHSASPAVVTCQEELADIIPTDRIRVAKRSIVEDRKWDYDSQWIETGARIATPVLHVPGHVPDAFVDQLRQVVSSKDGENERPIDVSHYWRSCTTPGDSTYTFHYNRFRRVISEILNETASKRRAGLKIVDRVGIQDTDERNTGTDDEAVETDTSFHVALLASSKIVIVTQNDEWEDNDNKLMEALASGAMVMTDSMVVPPLGLKHKTNIVFFDSPDALRSLIRYYLKETEKRQTIARHGRQYALGRHRPWQTMESLLFGKPLTSTDKSPLIIEAPPKRQHARENARIRVAL
jgi:Glycosyl transferases group 1